MIKDITIGQYFPGKSVLHRMDARVKILLTAVFIVMLFMAKSIQALSVGILFTLITFIISRIPLRMMGKSLKPIVPIVIFTAVLNLFFIRTGDVLWQWKIIKLTSDGVDTSLFMVIRIICLICGSSLLTYTTSPIELTDAIEKLLGPLKKIKVPVHELAMMMTIASLKFTETFLVSRSVSRTVLSSSVNFIALSPYCFDYFRFTYITFKFLPQVKDMHHDRVSCRCQVLFTPYVLVQILVLNYLSAVIHEIS